MTYVLGETGEALLPGRHGTNGLGGNGGRSLAVTGLERIRAQVVNGGGGMPAFRGRLTQQQINDVSASAAERIGR
jgi:mono/diheme cytochrome c family protein